MTNPYKSPIGGALFALSGFAIFSTHDVIVKYLGGFYAPFQIVFFSVVLSFPLVLIMLIGEKGAGTLRPVHPWWTALRTVAVAVTASCAFYAFATVPLTQVYALLFAMPLLITVLSIPILGERVGIHRWAAVVIGLIGVVIVLRPGAGGLGLGHLAAITAAGSGSLAAIIVRKIGRDERNAVLLLFPMLANFVAMGALLPFVYRPMPLEHLGATAIVALLAFSGGLLIVQAYKAAEAAIVAPMQYSQILWAALFGWFLFRETADLMTWLGSAVIIASGLYIVLREAFGASVTTPVLRTKSRAETGTAPRLPSVDKLRRSGL